MDADAIAVFTPAARKMCIRDSGGGGAQCLHGVLGVAEAQRDADRGVVALGVALCGGDGRGGLGGGDVDRAAVVDAGAGSPDEGLGEDGVDCLLYTSRCV